MKIISVAAVLLLLISGLLSCKKSNNSNISLTGNWHLKSDSTFIVSAVANGVPTIYHGVATDYYQFTDDGHLYVKENKNIDTATYHLSGDQLNLNYSYLLQNGVTITGATGLFTVSDYTANKVTLTSRITSPFAQNVQIINLTK